MAKTDDMTQDNEILSFPEKWAKIIEKMPEFKDNADASSTEDLKKMIVTCEGNLYEIDKAKAADVKLNAAKDIVKEYGAPYNESIRVQTAKIKYVLFLLENKGVEIGDKEGNEE